MTTNPTMTADESTEADWKDAFPDGPGRVQFLPDTVQPATVPAQFDEFNLAVRRMLGLEDASDGEIELFFHVCHKSGLDPFNKEVYMIGRNTEVAFWEPVNENEPDGQKRKVKRWVTKYTIQTGINGFRKKAREIAEARGIDYRQDDPLWCGDDAVWKEVWPEKKPPVAAKFVVWRDDKRYSFVAHYDEYVQESGTGAERRPNSMWGKMFRNQLRKCAEAGAIQAAFPDELGGLVLDLTMPDPDDTTIVIDEHGQPVQPTKQRERPKGSGLRDRSKSADAGQPAPTEGTVDPPKVKHTKAREKLNGAMFRYLGAVDLTADEKRQDRLIVLTRIADRDELITSSNDLTDDEVQEINKTFDAVGDIAAANGMVTSILNAWVAAHGDDTPPAEPAADTGQEN